MRILLSEVHIAFLFFTSVVLSNTICAEPSSNPAHHIAEIELIGKHSMGSINNSSYLLLKKDHSFIFENIQNKQTSKQTGIWSYKNKTLKLSMPGTLNSSKSIVKYECFRWGGIVSMVAKKNIIDFCNELNKGNNGSRYCLRKDLWLDKPNEAPHLPPKWKRYLLEDVLKGKVTKIQGTQTAIINLGREHRLLPQMTLLTFETLELEDSAEKKYQHNIRAIKVLECFDNKAIVIPLDSQTRLKVGQDVYSKLVLYQK